MPPLVALIELPLNGGGVLPINGNILTLGTQFFVLQAILWAS